MHPIDPAATAWLLASTALVLLMTPGLAIFYGGMVRTTGVVNMMTMSFISISAPRGDRRLQPSGESGRANSV
jgi:Amt family ammonium transporter